MKMTDQEFPIDDYADLMHKMRVKSGITQARLARKLGYSDRGAVVNREKMRMDTSVYLLGKWARACGFEARISFHRLDEDGA